MKIISKLFVAFRGEHTHILALILYFFESESINSHTNSSKLADINLKQFVADNDVVFFKNNFSNNLTSSFRLFNADVADISSK